MSIHIQNQIRNNATDIRSYVEDLYNWEQQLQKKKDKHEKNEENKSLIQIPIRGKVDEQERKENEDENLTSFNGQSETKEVESTNNQTKVKLKRDNNSIKDYYAAWDKYDVDKQLEKIEKVHQQEQVEQRRKDINSQYNPYQNYELKGKRAHPNTRVVVKGGQSYSSDAITCKDQGNLNYKSLDYEKALECYTQGLEKLISIQNMTEEDRELNVILLSNRAMTYIKMKEFLMAERDCRQSLKQDEKHIKSLCRLGVSLKMQQKLKQALTIFQKVKELEADNEDALREIPQLTNTINLKQKSANEKLNLPFKTSDPASYVAVNVIDTDKDILQIQEQEEEQEVKFENNRFTRIKQIDQKLDSAETNEGDDIFNDDKIIIRKKSQSRTSESDESSKDNGLLHSILQNEGGNQVDHQMLSKLKNIDGQLVRHYSDEEQTTPDAKEIMFQINDQNIDQAPSYHKPHTHLYPTHHILKNSALTKPGEFKNLREIDLAMQNGQEKDQKSGKQGSGKSESQENDTDRAIQFGSAENMENEVPQKYNPKLHPRRGSLQVATMPFVKGPASSEDNSPTVNFDELRNIEGQLIIQDDENLKNEELSESPVKRTRKVSFEKYSNETSGASPSLENKKKPTQRSISSSTGSILLQPAIQSEQNYQDDPLITHLQNVQGQVIQKTRSKKNSIERDIEKFQQEQSKNVELDNDDDEDSDGKHHVQFEDVLIAEAVSNRKTQDRKQRGSILKNPSHPVLVDEKVVKFQQVGLQLEQQQQPQTEVEERKTKSEDVLQGLTALELPSDAEIQQFNLVSFMRKWNTFQNHSQHALNLLSKVSSPIVQDSIFKQGVDVPVFKEIISLFNQSQQNEDNELTLRYLDTFTQLKRFDITVMCLIGKEKEVIRGLINKLEQNGVIPGEQQKSLIQKYKL